MPCKTRLDFFQFDRLLQPPGIKFEIGNDKTLVGLYLLSGVYCKLNTTVVNSCACIYVNIWPYHISSGNHASQFNFF